MIKFVQRAFTSSTPLQNSYMSKFPLFFNKSGLMKVYEASKQHQRLSIYRYIPYAIVPFLFYGATKNEMKMYRDGFDSWSFTKTLFWYFLLFNLYRISRNMNHHSSKLVLRLYLQSDGQNIRL